MTTGSSSLQPGLLLGPYEVLAPLGAGGMGEVYRAKDTRLGREVAVKVLPAALSSDQGRLRRFEQEARAAGALSHPNIVVVFDVGSHAGSPYVVSELLEGETLREALRSLSTRKAVDYGAQIARGLAAAHEKGIVHRDLKPENVFVTHEGRAKILDFGLAKVLSTEAAPDRQSEVPTLSQITDAGTVLGTTGYMSPEQVRGLVIDHRSDIFSLGAVLYEMLSGQRPFRGATQADTMMAILKEDPPELSLGRPGLPPALDRIVHHCLEKAPAERFQSARDVAFNLESLSSFSGTSTTGTGLEGLLRRRWPRAISLAAAAVAAMAGAFVGGRMTADRPVPDVRTLTFRSGYVTSARFAPDGRTAVYGAAWDGGPVELYSVRPESPESKPLGLPPAGILAISSSGEMAVSLGCRLMVAGGGCHGTLAVVPFTGGAPRELLEHVLGADWSPDGKQLAVARLTGDKFRIEFPVGTVLLESSDFAAYPRVSPRGDLVAFIDHPPGDPWGSEPGAVMVVDRKGVRRVLARGFRWGGGLAWTPDGREVWYSGSFSGANQIHAVTLRGRDRLVDQARGRLEDLSPQGQALLVGGGGAGSRVGIVGQAPGETRERNLSWFNYSVPADLSADGHTLLFGERLAGVSGTQFGVYLRKTDGSPAVRLGDGTAQALSPDGKRALARTAPGQMTLLPTGAGSSRVLPSSAIEQYSSAAWMPDGRRVLLVGKEQGHDWRSYVQDLEAGEPRAVTPEGVQGVVVSPDGRFVAAARDDQPYALYPLDGGPPSAVPALTPDDEPVRWSRDGRAIYVVRNETRLKATVFRIELSGGRRVILKEFQPSDPAGILGFAIRVLVDADGRSYVYSFNRVTNQLSLAEGLR